MNHDTLHRLIAICQQMKEEGKTPSVGLLRSKAPFKTSVTEAIEAIKRFNAGDVTKPATRAIINSDVRRTDSEMASRLDALEKEVASLKKTLNAMIKND